MTAIPAHCVHAFTGITVWGLAKLVLKLPSVASLPPSVVRVVLPTTLGEGPWVLPEHQVELVEHLDSACMVATSMFWLGGQLVMLPSTSPGQSFKRVKHAVPLHRQYLYQQQHGLAPPSVEQECCKRAPPQAPSPAPQGSNSELPSPLTPHPSPLTPLRYFELTANESASLLYYDDLDQRARLGGRPALGMMNVAGIKQLTLMQEKQFKKVADYFKPLSDSIFFSVDLPFGDGDPVGLQVDRLLARCAHHMAIA